MKTKISALALNIALLVSGCTSAQLDGIQKASSNFQQAIASINADIAAVAPLVAKSCGDLQTAAMLIQPFVPTNAKAPQYFSAANAALVAYCQNVPTNITQTAQQVAVAVIAARNGYYNVTGAKING